MADVHEAEGIVVFLRLTPIILIRMAKDIEAISVGKVGISGILNMDNSIVDGVVPSLSYVRI